MKQTDTERLQTLLHIGQELSRQIAERGITPKLLLNNEFSVETARIDFGGVCRVPLYLIISVGVDENIARNNDLPASMIVDYVRAYQYK